MDLIFHGGASEVGRSCIELRTDKGNKYLFDVGIKFKPGGLLFPENVRDIKEFDGVFLSHAHLDHSGGLPLFEHRNLEGPIFCTRQTFGITKILLKDSFKIHRIKNFHVAYNNTDLKKVRDDTRLVSFDKWYRHKDLRFKYLNAGHIPGSAMILVEVENKRLLYTADFNTKKTPLMFNTVMSNERKNVDVLITESTYGYRDLPDRPDVIKKFLKKIKETLDRGGSVLIPVFALGRAQETLILLNELDSDVPIYLDGMAKQITRKILANKSKFVDNKEILRKMFYERVKWVSSERKRKHALKKQGIYVSTSGMLQGGPVLNYLKELWHNEKNLVCLMGFQAKNSNGRHLLEEGYVYLDGWKTEVKCEVEKFDFSGHVGREDLQKYVTEINPKHVIFQHGDEESVNALKDWAEQNLDAKVYVPRINDKYSL